MEGIDDALVDVATAGGIDALDQIGVDDSEDIVSLVNDDAVEYARERSADMVGKKWVDGELIDNPKAEWIIDEATRDMLRGTVTTAMEEGWSNDKLADEIASSHAFSDERSMMIARTETAFADVEGNLAAYRASGLVSQKQWLASEDCCDDCQELDGEIVDLDEDFSGDGGSGPPLHPNCECDVLPVLDESEGNDQT